VLVLTAIALWAPFALLAIASVWDLRTREIPDAIPVVLLLWAVSVHVLHLTPISWLAAAEGLALGIVIGLATFRFGLMGGGDAKLLVALGALLGPLAFVVFLLFVSIAGGLFAIVAKIRGETELPYAPAFALGWLGLVLLR
jgi:prepilin peptidase CpaA